MKFQYRVLSICVLAALCQPAWADHTITTQSVKVSDKKLVTSLTQPDLDEAKEEINKTAGGVTIVDAEKFREGRVSNFSDTLGMATGVYAQSRFGAEETRLAIRGSGLQRTFHGRGIKLMQDGIPVNLADGGFDFPAIEPIATRYVEVYRGANALQHGASNLGGAINYVSRTGYNAPKFEARTEFGSFGYQRYGIATGGVIDNFDYYVNSTVSKLDGFRDNAEQSSERTNANFGYRFNENVETRFFVGYTNNNSELPSNLTKTQLNRDPQQSTIVPGQGINKRNLDLWRIANKTTFTFDNTRIEIGAFYSSKDLFHPIIDLAFLGPFAPTLGVIDQKTDDYGINARLLHDGHLFGLRNEFIAGVSPTYGTTEDKRFRNINAHRGALTNRFDQTASNFEAFAENRLFVLQDLALVTGLQYVRSKREAKDKLIAATGDESYNETYTQTNPKLGLLYQMQPNVQMFANVSRSFEPPSFGELTNRTTAAVLKAQKGTTFEIGTRGNGTHVDWDIAAYYARLSDELLETFIAPGASATRNASKTIHKGIEMGMTARLPFNLEWRHSLLINDFKFDGDNNFDDNRLAGIPRSFMRGELLYRAGGFYAGPTIETSPQRYAVDFANTTYNDNYTLLGWKMGQQINQHISWFIEGRNLTDRKYASATGVVSQINPFNNNVFLPGDGRAVYMGLQYRY